MGGRRTAETSNSAPPLDKVTNCNYTISMIMKLLGHEDYLRILLALRQEGKGLRFDQIKKMMNLNPTQVDRALKFLRKELWIITHVLPIKEGRILVEYRLGKRGVAFLESFDSFRSATRQRISVLGATEINELQNLSHNRPWL